jgi:hypothetical protein
LQLSGLYRGLAILPDFAGVPKFEEIVLSYIGPCEDHRRGGGDSPSDVIGQNGAQPRNPLAMVVRVAVLVQPSVDFKES